MSTTDLDRVARAYARLQALKGNLPQETYVRERYVSEYHEIVDQHLVSTFDVTEFRIPEKWLVHLDESGRPQKGNTVVYLGPGGNAERWVERQSFLVRLDAILGYFQLLVQEPHGSTRQRIGFHGTTKK